MFLSKKKLFLSIFGWSLFCITQTTFADNMPTKQFNISNGNETAYTLSNGEKDFSWLSSEGGDSDVNLRLSNEGTLYISGGNIYYPNSMINTLSAVDIDPSEVKKIIVEDTLYIEGVASYLFAFLPEIQEFENLNKIDVSNVTRLDSAFGGCSKLQELDLSTWDMSSYDSDASGIFNMCPELKKLVLGPNFKLTSVSGLTDPPQDNPVYTGKWAGVGLGSERRPKGIVWDSAALFSENYDGKTQADTYIWEPAAAKITIKYVDIENKEIHPPLYNTDMNVGEDYDVTIPDYKLDISGYILDDSNPPLNATGKIIDREDIIVIYTYKKKYPPSIDSGSVITKFVDENNIDIAEQVIKTGNVGENYTTVPLKIENYELDEERFPTNAMGTYTKENIIVTYIYKNIIGTGKIVIRFVDENNIDIAEQVIKTGNVGENYTTVPLKIENYELDEERLPTNAMGTYTKENITITYTYKKINNPNLTNEDSIKSYGENHLKSINSEPEELTPLYPNKILPNMGDVKYIILTFLGVSIISSIYFFYKKYRG